MKDIIHVLGDSHCGYFLGKHPGADTIEKKEYEDFWIHSFKFGATGSTLYGLKNNDSATNARIKFIDYVNSKEVKTLVIVMGDVDCTWHFINEKDPRERMDETIEIFRKFLEENVIKKVDKIILCGMIPLEDKDKIKIFIKILFQEKLKKLANEMNLGFIDLFDSDLTVDGYLKNMFASGDNIHMKYDELVASIVTKKLKAAI